MLQSNNEESRIDSISIDEWILILLYAQKDKPITGKLMFVKQAFLLAKDVIPSLGARFKFYPYSFGPYSKEFAKSVNDLIEKGYITLEVDNDIYRFRLSTKGKEIAEDAFNKLPDKYKMILKRKRRGWDQLGYTGIVRLVYTKYPEYAVNSKIVETV